jgi:3,4-dihydroxy 2-butanone 4-phosphate synthase/GTP cyclohydrolase II
MRRIGQNIRFPDDRALEITMAITPTQQLIDDIRRGRMIVLADAEDRENEGDLVLAADFVTPEAINFLATYARGLVCLTLSEERCRQLNLPLMVNDNRSPMGTAFTVSIEAASGVSTGISAADRARTVRAATARHAKPEDLVQPGHIFPVMAQKGGVLVRAGHTEAGCDLAELAGLTPAAVICEIMNADGSMARMPELLEFAKQHDLRIGTIADLIHHRSQTEKLVERVADRAVATPYGTFRLCVYHDKTVDEVHYALVKGEPSPDRPILVRVHEPFVSLDLFDFDSARHAFSVQDAMRMVSREKEGVIVLLRRPEPAAEILERLDESKSRKSGARKWDPRLHGIGAQILKDLNVGKMRVLARPKRIPSMSGFGLEVVEYVAPEDAVAVRAAG